MMRFTFNTSNNFLFTQVTQWAINQISIDQSHSHTDSFFQWYSEKWFAYSRNLLSFLLNDWFLVRECNSVYISMFFLLEKKDRAAWTFLFVFAPFIHNFDFILNTLVQRLKRYIVLEWRIVKIDLSLFQCMCAVYWTN